MPTRLYAPVLLAVCLLLGAYAHAQNASGLRVQLPANAPSETSGRLLLFAEPAESALKRTKDGVVATVDAGPFSPGASAFAMEVSHVAPGSTVAFDANAIAYPQPLSQLPDGDYYMQAVLDVCGDDNYAGRGVDDISSVPMRVSLRGGQASSLFVIDQHAPPLSDPWKLSDRVPALIRDAAPEARAHTREIDFTSASLSTFWNHPVHMRGWVLLPPGYDSQSATRYPVVYQTHGFSGSYRKQVTAAIAIYAAMQRAQMPPMIVVLLDQSSPTGTHEFADSANNGPWGTALTKELIPALEQQYRMDATPSGRFLNGHSSGGWAALWLQTRYPAVFGGAWATSPDPADFHDFFGINLYAPHANVYRNADGSAYPIMRDQGQVLSTFEQFARMEAVIGPKGGQMSSFEWVFSPLGKDGLPVPMFDRSSGAVDPAVIAYWREHYDIAHIIQRDWPTLKPQLDGKIHVTVGGADSFYLEGPALRLKKTLDSMGARSEVRVLPGKTHFDLYAEGDDEMALMKQIFWQMYATARPGARPQPAPTAATSNHATASPR